MSKETVAIVGLGYVGLPLAAAFGELCATIGFDLDHSKLASLRDGIDPGGEVGKSSLDAATYLELTNNPARLADASVIIVVVPTPIDAAKKPDLGLLEAASTIVGRHMQPGATVVFESTVYPGCTEEVCVPILERASGMQWGGSDPGKNCDEGDHFYVGYSPERINPGDPTRTLQSIVKVVAGDTSETRARLVSLYGSIIDAGVYAASSIKVAEAAKVIENTQRDLNISLMNELAMIFDRLEIDTLEVLEAAGTKWNFLPFRPGLVGGHCIGVDPYYLTYKAESVGYHPSVVLAGRRINDGMGKFIAEQTVKGLAARQKPITGSKVTVLGLTFKEDCSDLRNSRVIDVIRELEDFGCSVAVCDPVADDAHALSEYGIALVTPNDLAPADAVVLAVPHKEYRDMPTDILSAMLVNSGLVVDVKGVVDQQAAERAGLSLWRL